MSNKKDISSVFWNQNQIIIFQYNFWLQSFHTQPLLPLPVGQKNNKGCGTLLRPQYMSLSGDLFLPDIFQDPEILHSLLPCLSPLIFLDLHRFSRSQRTKRHFITGISTNNEVPLYARFSRLFFKNYLFTLLL